MSKAFKGEKIIEAVAEEISERTGTQIILHGVSDEPTTYADGEYPIDRGAWEDALIRLFDAYAPDRDNYWREYGEDFENEIFYVRYDRQDYECTCGFEEEADSYNEQHSHKPDCWKTRVGRADDEIQARWEPIIQAAQNARDKLPNRPPRGDTPEQRELLRVCNARDAEIDQWLRDNGWEEGKPGLHVYCDCGMEAVIEAWFKEHGHRKPCEGYWADQPNFLHKPSGYGVFWYKYPCRGAHGNQPMTAKKFNQ